MSKKDIFHTMQVRDYEIRGFLSGDGPSIGVKQAKTAYEGQVGIGVSGIRFFTPENHSGQTATGWWLVKYRDQPRFLFEGITEKEAALIAVEFGLEFYNTHGARFDHREDDGLYGSKAWPGLVAWVSAHPRISADFASCENYLPGWHAKARLEAKAAR